MTGQAALAEEIRAYMAANADSLARVAAEAPPPPAEALEILRATRCPVIRPHAVRAAS